MRKHCWLRRNARIAQTKLRMKQKYYLKKKKSRRLLKLIFYLVARGFVAIGVDSRCGELGDGTSRGKRIEREIKRDGKRGMAIDLLTILLLKDL